MRLLIAVLSAVALEIVVLVLAVQYLGAGPTFGLLVLNVIVGSWLLRREGRRTVREVTESARLRRPPERGLGDGVITAASGILVMVPGFLTDVVALLCLLPFTRALLRRRLQRAAETWSQREAERMAQAGRRQQAGFGSVHAGMWPGAAAAGTTPGQATSGGRSARGTAGEDVIDGEVISVEDEEDTPSGRSQHPTLGRSAQSERPSGGRAG